MEIIPYTKVQQAKPAPSKSHKPKNSFKGKYSAFFAGMGSAAEKISRNAQQPRKEDQSQPEIPSSAFHKV